MVWNLGDVAVNTFAHCSYQIFMALEASGSCCESIIAGLESRGSCCEAIYELLQRIFMVLNFQEVAVKRFALISNELLIF